MIQPVIAPLRGRYPRRTVAAFEQMLKARDILGGQAHLRRGVEVGRLVEDLGDGALAVRGRSPPGVPLVAVERAAPEQGVDLLRVRPHDEGQERDQGQVSARVVVVVRAQVTTVEAARGLPVGERVHDLEDLCLVLARRAGAGGLALGVGG